MGSKEELEDTEEYIMMIQFMIMLNTMPQEMVDQNAISDLLHKYSFETKVVKYFSTQSSAFQYFGEKI